MLRAFTRTEKTLLLVGLAVILIAAAVLLFRPRPASVEITLVPVGQPKPANAPLNINRATVEDFAALPGVGPVLAAGIVEWRDSRGIFRTLDDLLEVPGFGPSLLAKIRPQLVAGP